MSPSWGRYTWLMELKIDVLPAPLGPMMENSSPSVTWNETSVMALSIADYGYIMETGKVVMDGPAEKLLGDEDVQEFYLGLRGDEGERKSFRDVKHYKRRKRWLS